MNVSRKMGGKVVKEDNPIELSALFIIILKPSSIQRQKNIEEAQKQYKLYKLYKNLNPKYFENIISLKRAKLKVDSSDIIYSSKYNFIRPY